MLLSSLLLIPILGIFLIYSTTSYRSTPQIFPSIEIEGSEYNNNTYYKIIALGSSIINLIISLIIYISFDFSSNQFQFVQEDYDFSYFDIYLGIDGLSIYFVLLTTIIMPIALLSNWNSITENVKSYLIIMLLLETLLLAVFLVLDILLFYIFFESILPPLFLLIGLFGSGNKVRASYYIFLYTLGSSLFLLLSILTMSSIMGTTDFDALFKTNFDYTTQLFIFVGVFIAIAVKTPTIFLNNWLLRAHVESPLGGSIVLAAKITMAALNLAKCWKNHISYWIWSISRKLLSLIIIKGSLTHIYWDKVVFYLRYINSLLSTLGFCYCFKLGFMNIHLINTWFKLQDFKSPFLWTMVQAFSGDWVPDRTVKIINLKLNRISRGHTLEVIYTKLNKNFINQKAFLHTKTADHNNHQIDKSKIYPNKNFATYLAGLIEGDGAIYIPKKNIGAGSIVIAFYSKDLPLALIIQKNLSVGNIYKSKGKNAYTYVISDIKGLIKVVSLINGNMRTPKIVQLYKLIDWISTKGNNPIIFNKLSLDNSPLNSNAWLSGFIDSDGCFSVRVSDNKNCSTKKISVMLALVQKTVSLNNDSLFDIMFNISKFLECNLKITKKGKYPQYSARTVNLKGNLAVQTYLNQYPLFSSKYLDFLVWEKVLIMMVKKEHKKSAEVIIKLKESMNSRRTLFKWNHLNEFYPYHALD